MDDEAFDRGVLKIELCRQCKADFINVGGVKRCGNCGLPAVDPGPAVVKVQAPAVPEAVAPARKRK